MPHMPASQQAAQVNDMTVASMLVLISRLVCHATGSTGGQQVVLLFTCPPPKIKDPILKNVPHQ